MASTTFEALNLERQEAVTKYKYHAQCLGELCMSWAALDRILDDLFEPILACTPAQVACIVTNLENVSARCAILEKLIIMEDVGDGWREWFIAVLRRVSGELAPLRNRYVHDHWNVKIDQVIRTDKRAKVAKAQSHQPPQVMFDNEHVTDPADIERLTMRVLACLGALALSEQSLRSWRRKGGHLEVLPLLLPVIEPHARYLSPQELFQAHLSKQTPEPYAFD